MEYLLIYIILGSTFLLAGLALKFFPPKKINSLYGYRTTLSMTDQKYWDFSQRYSGRLSIALSLIMFVIGISLKLLDINIITALIICVIVTLTTGFLIIFLTEKAIKNKFSLTKKSADT
jgi:uncharacterized membrane protein